MKNFVNPEVMFVYFTKDDIIAASTPCDCDECPECPEGYNLCQCNDEIDKDYIAPGSIP